MTQRDLTIVGDLLRYSGMLFALFFVIGLVLCLVDGFSLMALLVNPLIYALGIAMIVVVITHDLDSLLALVGLGGGAKLSPHIQYHNDLQEIGMLMGLENYQEAMKKVDRLLRRAPSFARAYNLRGEILLNGFGRKRQARECFDRAMTLSLPDDEDHRLAQSLRASTFT